MVCSLFDQWYDELHFIRKPDQRNQCKLWCLECGRMSFAIHAACTVFVFVLTHRVSVLLQMNVFALWLACLTASWAIWLYWRKRKYLCAYSYYFQGIWINGCFGMAELSWRFQQSNTALEDLMVKGSTSVRCDNLSWGYYIWYGLSLFLILLASLVHLSFWRAQD